MAFLVTPKLTEPVSSTTVQRAQRLVAVLHCHIDRVGATGQWPKRYCMGVAFAAVAATVCSACAFAFAFGTTACKFGSRIGTLQIALIRVVVRRVAYNHIKWSLLRQLAD